MGAAVVGRCAAYAEAVLCALLAVGLILAAAVAGRGAGLVGGDGSTSTVVRAQAPPPPPAAPLTKVSLVYAQSSAIFAPLFVTQDHGFLHPNTRLMEGPFGEWTGYYASGSREEPVIDVKAIYHPAIGPDPAYKRETRRVWGWLLQRDGKAGSGDTR